jgi:hypothetical protein
MEFLVAGAAHRLNIVAPLGPETLIVQVMDVVGDTAAKFAGRVAGRDYLLAKRQPMRACAIFVIGLVPEAP